MDQERVTELVPLLSANDLQGLGVARGPELGRLIRALEDEQLAGRISDRDAAEVFVRENSRSSG